MDKSFLNEIVEMRLLSERMDGKFSPLEIEQRRKELLCEMAFSRGEFKDYLMSQTTTIISHFALIKEASVTNTNTELIEHWRNELKNYIMDFQEMDTKPKSGKRDMVSRALTERWVTDMELSTHPEYVVRRFASKFKEEHILINDEMADFLANQFISEMPNIIREMSYGTEESTTGYVNGL